MGKRRSGKKGSRRAKGEGCIHQRKSDGMWLASVTIGRDAKTGKLIRKVVYAKTQEEAVAKKQALQQRYAGGVVYKDADKLTVKEWVEKWLNVYAKVRVRANTFAGYRCMVKNHIVPTLGHLRLQKLRAIDIQTMVNNIVEAGRSPRLAQSAFEVLRMAVNKAVEDEILQRSPCGPVDVPKKKKMEQKPLTKKEWAQLFEAAKKEPAIYTALVVVWATGISRSEILALRWSDIHWQTRTIFIRRADIITDNGPDIHDPKAPTRRRALVVPRQVIEELRRHKKRVTEGRLRAKAWEENDLVFPAENGRLQDPRNWSKKFARVAKAAKVRVTFHRLRHDHASRLADAKVGIKDAQYRLGHATSRMLLDVYTHRMSDSQERIAAMLEKNFPQPRLQ